MNRLNRFRFCSVSQNKLLVQCVVTYTALPSTLEDSAKRSKSFRQTFLRLATFARPVALDRYPRSPSRPLLRANKITRHMVGFFCFRVRRRGLEPPTPCGGYHLKVVRLPISPPARAACILGFLARFCKRKGGVTPPSPPRLSPLAFPVQLLLSAPGLLRLRHRSLPHLDRTAELPQQW